MNRIILFLALPLLLLLGACSDADSDRAADLEAHPYKLDRSSTETREVDGYVGPVERVVTTVKKVGRYGSVESKITRWIDERYDTHGHRIYRGQYDNENDYSDTTQWAYDEYGRAEINSDYQRATVKNGCVTRIENYNEPGKTGTPAYVYSYEYDNLGRVTHAEGMEGVAEEFGGCLDWSVDFTYATDGRLVKKTESQDFDEIETTYGEHGMSYQRITYGDDNGTTESYSLIPTKCDDNGNMIKGTMSKVVNGKETLYVFEREITYFDGAPAEEEAAMLPPGVDSIAPADSGKYVSMIDYSRISNPKNAIPFTGAWFDRLSERYQNYKIRTSGDATGTLVAIAIVLTALLAALLIWIWCSTSLIGNWSGTMQASSRMKRLWMYNVDPYRNVAMISVAILVAFIAAIAVLFLFGGVSWALTGLLWLVLKALIFVGYACAILGGLALVGKEAVGCLPLVVGVIIIAWKDEINSFGERALAWGYDTFSSLNIFEWGWLTAVEFWDVVLIVFMAPLILFLAIAAVVILLDLLLMGIEWVITRIYSVRRPCPSCGSTRTPEYIIGGRPHPVRLAPGLYGTFTHRSPTTGESVPTMLLNGRGKLQRRCRDCGKYINSGDTSRSFGTELHIGLVGPRSSGKSYLLYSALDQLMNDNAGRIEQIDRDSETDIATKARAISAHGGIQTKSQNRYRGVQLIVKSKLRPVPYHLFFYDVAGEKFNVGSLASKTAMEFYSNVQSIIFVIDPTMTDLTMTTASAEMIEWANKHAGKLEKNNLESTYQMMNRILEEQGRKKSGIDITFVVVKTDSGYFEALGMPESGNTPEMIESFIVNHMGLSLLVNAARADFKSVSFGAASVYGAGREDMRALFAAVLRRLGV